MNGYTFREILEARLDEWYLRWMKHMADRKTPGEEYHYRCGYLKAIQDIGEECKAISKEMNDSNFKGGENDRAKN